MWGLEKAKKMKEHIFLCPHIRWRGRELLKEPMLPFRSPDSITTYTMLYEAREEGHSLFMRQKKLSKSSKDICALQMNKMLYALNKKRSQC